MRAIKFVVRRKNLVSVGRQRNKNVMALAVASTVAGIAGYAHTVQAGTIADNGSANSLTSPGAWVGGVAPQSTDIAQFGSLITGAYSEPLGGAANWGEIQVLNPGGSVTIAADGNTLTLSGIVNAAGTTVGIDMSGAKQSLTINSGLILGSTQQWNVASGQTLTVGGVIGDGGLGFGITTNGQGTISLAGANTYAGPTTISGGGTLNLNFAGGSAPAANIINATSALVLGGGTLSVIGSGTITSSQTFSATTVGAGSSVVSIGLAAGGTPTLARGAITRSAGGMVEFVGPATIGAANVAVAATTTINTTTAGAAAPAAAPGLLGGVSGNTGTGIDYATVGLYDWAATVADPVSGNDIVGASQIAGFYTTLANNQTNTADLNYDVTASSGISGAGSSRVTINSMRFNTAAAITVTFQPGQTGHAGNPVNLGGILVTPNVGINNVTFANDGSDGINSSNTTSQGLAVWQNNTSAELIFSQSTDGATFTNIQGSTYDQAGPGRRRSGNRGGYQSRRCRFGDVSQSQWRHAVGQLHGKSRWGHPRRRTSRCRWQSRWRIGRHYRASADN
jgi:autotransporter-associated beta strand protein